MFKHPNIGVTPLQTIVYVEGKKYVAVKVHTLANPCYNCAFRTTNYCNYVPCCAEERIDNTNVTYQRRIL